MYIRKYKKSRMEANEWPTSVQEREMLAMRAFYGDSDKACTRVRVRLEIEAPLEKTRLYGPFGIEVIAWVVKLHPYVPVTMGWDADGREYIEY